MVELLPCPFCSAAMRLRKHTAFHPENDCWLATSGDYGQPLEIAECDYAAWNRRSVPATQEAVERVARALFEYGRGDDSSLRWDQVEPSYHAWVRGAARAALAASGHAPTAGWVSVPVEPTEAMLAAAGYADATEEGKDYIRMRYRLMIAAAGRPE